MGGRVPPAAGAVVLRREPGNLVGWLLSALGLSVLLARPLQIYADSGFPGDSLPADVWAGWAANWLVAPALYGPILFLLLVFPTVALDALTTALARGRLDIGSLPRDNPLTVLPGWTANAGLIAVLAA